MSHRASRLRHEVNEFFDAPDQRGFQVIPVTDRRADALPRFGDVGLIGMWPAGSRADAVLPLDVSWHRWPHLEAEPVWFDRLPNVHIGVAHHQRVGATGST